MTTKFFLTRRTVLSSSVCIHWKKSEKRRRKWANKKRPIASKTGPIRVSHATRCSLFSGCRSRWPNISLSIRSYLQQIKKRIWIRGYEIVWEKNTRHFVDIYIRVEPDFAIMQCNHGTLKLILAWKISANSQANNLIQYPSKKISVNLFLLACFLHSYQ